MAGPPVRERFNAKARGSTAGSGGHKKRKRPSAKARAEALGSDGDVEMKEPVKAAEPPAGSGMSSKKRKRMESYIVSYFRRRVSRAGSDQLTIVGQKAQVRIQIGDYQAPGLPGPFHVLVSQYAVFLLARPKSFQPDQRTGA